MTTLHAPRGRSVAAAAALIAVAAHCTPTDVLASRLGAKRTVRLARQAALEAELDGHPHLASRVRSASAVLAAYFGGTL